TAEDPNRAAAVVRDRDLVAAAIDVDRDRPVQAGVVALNLSQRRGVALGVGRIYGDRRLIEPAAFDGLRLGHARAALPCRRVARRRRAATLIAVIGDDELVVRVVVKDAVRVAEPRLRSADRA